MAAASNFVQEQTIMAQKALSAVACLKEDVDPEYLIDFLRGSKSEKISDTHKQLKTYGVGATQSRQEWLNHIRDLISFGYLRYDAGRTQRLKLADKSQGVLRGEKVMFRQKIVSRQKTSTKWKKEIPYEPDLLDELAKLRKYLARKEDVPAYLIVLDEALNELATYLPVTKEEIKKIKGFNDANAFNKYAADFLKLIREYCAVNQLSSRIGLR